MKNPYEDLINGGYLDSAKPTTQFVGNPLTLSNLSEAISKIQKSIDEQDQLIMEAVKSGAYQALAEIEKANENYGKNEVSCGDQAELGRPAILQPTSLQTLIKENEDLKLQLTRKDEQLAILKNGKDLVEAEMRELSRQIEIGHILQRIHPKTHGRLLNESNEQISRIIPEQLAPAFLLSIDIRRSTDLMLNAKDAAKFAQFLDELSKGLAYLVKSHFGVFDKFTGDGALAFFPESFSGESAALNILLVAEKAHTFFAEHYRAFHSSFSSVLAETGLGIGIDYGDVNILRLSDGLTAVGKPVVYACRFSGAEAGTTLVNQNAFEMMRADEALEFDKVLIDIKHQGKHWAYRPKNSPRKELIKEPEWFSASPAPAE